MVDSLAAIVLAAGAGSRLRPLTRFLPKPLCPVGGSTLLDGNLERVAALVGSGPERVAVNVHHHADLLARHVGDRAHLSVEQPEALGTAGAVAHLRPWLDGRPALVVNGDTWSTIDLAPLVDDWDGHRVRVLVVGPPRLQDGVGILGSLLPAEVVAGLPHRPAGLYEACWRPLQADGRLEVVGAEGAFVPCDRPRDYLAANLLASGGASVVGAGAVVEGQLVRSVVWPGGVVAAEEVLVDAIRIGRTTTVRVR
ncbi:MAG: nucleotidyl transferase [Actinomycetia bacterium]|nr:nucleotidyl transferase [Actinomycetes bacterium]